LQDPEINVAPALRAADADAVARAAATKDQDAADSTAKSASPIAFRAGSSANKPTQ
jgi:hypothetical protein